MPYVTAQFEPEGAVVARFSRAHREATVLLHTHRTDEGYDTRVAVLDATDQACQEFQNRVEDMYELTASYSPTHFVYSVARSAIYDNSYRLMDQLSETFGDSFVLVKSGVMHTWMPPKTGIEADIAALQMDSFLKQAGADILVGVDEELPELFSQLTTHPSA